MKSYKTIIDVRAGWEYEDGHIEGSINIPLDQIMANVERIKAMPKPMLICCQGGDRSLVVSRYLKDNGIACDNGGGWEDAYAQLQNLDR